MEKSMDKKEFFAILRESLEGYVPKEEVEKNISYYQDYFHESELSEKEVLEELGDPRLLARTVIEAYKASKGPMADYYMDQARSEYSKEHSSAYEEEHREEKRKNFFGRVGAVVIGILIVCLILFLLKAAVQILYILLPVILLLIVVKILIDHMN